MSCRRGTQEGLREPVRVQGRRNRVARGPCRSGHGTALVERWSKLADAKDADLSRFRKSGGKLIITYGWADQVLQPMMGVRYYESVAATHGKETPDFARLFMIPGMSH